MADNISLIVNETIDNVVINPSITTEVVDVNVTGTDTYVDISVTPNLTTVNINRQVPVGVNGQDLQSVTDIGATTTNGITITVGDGDGNGVSSFSSQGYGIKGESNETFGVYGTSPTVGVYGNSDNGYGVQGYSESGVAVYGSSGEQFGVQGVSYTGTAIYADSDYGTGLYSGSTEGVGISAYSTLDVGLEVNGNGTIAIEANLGNSNKGLVINSGASSTGNFIELDKNGVDKLVVNQAGELTATKLIKQGGTSSQFLMADGSVSTGGGGGGATNLSTTQTESNFTINSDTGDDAVVPLGNGTLAGATLNDYTTTEKNKLTGIATGAEVNVNADWNAVSGDAQILNKPTIPTGSPITIVNDSSLFSTGLSGTGDGATNANYSNFLGDSAGYEATNASDSNFLGSDAGREATDAYNSNFLGPQAGLQATAAERSNFIGDSAGYQATNANNSNFIGTNTGYTATNANYSNFIGNGAGANATDAYNSNFLGYQAGRNATDANHSNLLGYNAGSSFADNNIGSNNIIIGTNISLPDATANSLNIGGILFGTGTYSESVSDTPSITPTSGGKIGIGVVEPTNTLHIYSEAANTSGLRLERLTSASPTTAGQAIGVDASGNIVTVTGGGGGGSSVNYYLNGGTSQGIFGGTTYYEFSKTAVIGTGADFNINTNGYIASFITDVADPSLLLIPAGNWNLEFFFSSSSAGGSPSFYVELYKYDGTSFTLITSSSTNPEGITGGTAIDAYFTPLAVPETILTVNDRLAIRVFVNASSKTITLHTQNGHLCEVITTFTAGLTALNGLQAQVQNFATGTTGTDFAINSSGSTHTFNLPSASATARGVVTTSSQTFAGDKTFTGAIGASNLSGTNTGDNATNTQYSGLATSKQDTLQSTVNIKSINGNSLLGSGDLTISASPTSQSAYTILANNTNASAIPTTQVYKDIAEQTYSLSPIFTGIAPITILANTYKWNQVGSLVTVRLTLNYSTAGSSATVTIPLPTDLPTPLSPNGFTGASDILYYGSGMSSINTTAVNTVTRNTFLRSNSTNNGYEFVVNAASAVSLKVVHLTLQYFT